MTEENLVKRILEKYDPEIDKRVIDELVEIESVEKKLVLPKPTLIPAKLDLSKHLRYIRQQGGAGCWGYAWLAVWDIMNEMKSPYSPNLSMRIWMMLHRRRELWEKENGIFTPDGRYHTGLQKPESGFFLSFGNTTEGTELTLHEFPSLWPDGGWSREGINEASNYRMKSKSKFINLSSESLVNALVQGYPIRLEFSWTDPVSKKSGAHFVAVVGYDTITKKFKYVNSDGDTWGDNGFSTFTFQEIDNHKAVRYYIFNFNSAEIIEILPPKPVPVARISFKHTCRSNVHLWLSAENSPLPKLKIWPQGYREKSRNLSFTVRLPSEFIWPPTENNRLVLDLYDSAEFSKSGGQLEEFTVVFGGHVIECPDLLKGPTNFSARDHKHFHIP
jgi:hypothetical protein